MIEPQRAVPYQELTVERWNELIDFVVASRNSPRVGGELAVKDGAIHTTAELKIRRAVVTVAVPPRQGLQMGQGTAKLCTSDQQGNIVALGGFNLRTVWSDSGNPKPIPVGTVIKIYFGEGKWQIFSADCSSTVPIPPDPGSLDPTPMASHAA